MVNQKHWAFMKHYLDLAFPWKAILKILTFLSQRMYVRSDGDTRFWSGLIRQRFLPKGSAHAMVWFGRLVSVLVLVSVSVSVSVLVLVLVC